MIAATITSKGQITLPKAVREFLHVHSGDRIAFLLRDGVDARIRPLTKSVTELYGKLSRPGQPVRSVEDMRNAMARRAKAKYR